MKRHWPYAVLALAAMIAAGGAWFYLRPLAVAVSRPQRGPAVDAVYATGTVEPTVMLPVSPRSGGRLALLAVDEGSVVHKGEVLARLDDADLVSTIDELDARERYARSSYARTRDLVSRHFLAASELDRSRSDLDSAVAARRRARVLRSYMDLTAPADGLVIRRDGEIGQFIPAGQAVLTLSCCAPLRVAAEVDEEDIARVAVGQAVVLRSDALPGKVFDGIVSDITPKGDPVARSYRVRIKLATPEVFHVGMTADANIIIAKRDSALLLPSAALQDGMVWILRDGHLHRQPVKAGAIGSNHVEIVEGIDAQTDVVSGPFERLREGRRAKPMPAVTQVP